ncbi:uncharacterized protein [Coffea arabica]|uniref:Uncharacterized protein n=1 Tax=Coffea arabica TaxID=13443 RepID=A0ABM4WKG0_COFAR
MGRWARRLVNITVVALSPSPIYVLLSIQVRCFNKGVLVMWLRRQLWSSTNVFSFFCWGKKPSGQIDLLSEFLVQKKWKCLLASSIPMRVLLQTLHLVNLSSALLREVIASVNRSFKCYIWCTRSRSNSWC